MLKMIYSFLTLLTEGSEGRSQSLFIQIYPENTGTEYLPRLRRTYLGPVC